MPWTWELPSWPQFEYSPNSILEKEQRLLLSLGSAQTYLKSLDPSQKNKFIVEILSEEGLESSKIEGEILERESLQSSIRKHFEPDPDKKPTHNKESGMADVLCSVYETYDQPLTAPMLWSWHSHLFSSSDLTDRGMFRTHVEPMQIISNRYGDAKIYFEAPPSLKIPFEMKRFIEWFNSTNGKLPILERAAIAHVYFELIHPFEDGNGRIGRLLVEKVLSQGIHKPVLIALSKVLERRKKQYYAELERCNRTLEIQPWIEYFSDVIIEGQQESLHLLHFLIEKSKILTHFAGKLNERQDKALLRMFAEGPKGFAGGLSADKYISITKAARATATRDLADLVQKGILIKTGELRHTRYWLNTAS
jgi:Fic family protein